MEDPHDRKVKWGAKQFMRFMHLGPPSADEDYDGDDILSQELELDRPSMEELKNDLFSGDPENHYGDYSVFDQDRDGHHQGLVGFYEDEEEYLADVDRAKATVPVWDAIKRTPLELVLDTNPYLGGKPKPSENVSLRQEMTLNALLKQHAHTDAVKVALGEDYLKEVPPWIVLKARRSAAVKACVFSEDLDSLPRDLDLIRWDKNDVGWKTAVGQGLDDILDNHCADMHRLGIGLLHISTHLQFEVWFEPRTGTYFRRYRPQQYGNKSAVALRPNAKGG